MSRAVAVLSSIWLLLAILVSLTGVLIWASIGGTDFELGAIKKDIYKSWWFNGLLALLGVNLTVCTLKRNPIKNKKWGYLITHIGIDTILVGAVITNLTIVKGRMNIFEGQIHQDIGLEDKQEILVKTPRGVFQFPVTFSQYEESAPERTLFLSDTDYLTVKKYIPKATISNSESIKVEMLDQKGFTKSLIVNKDDPHFFSNYRRVLFVERSEKVRTKYFSKGKLAITLGEKQATIDVGEHTGKPFQLDKYTITIKELHKQFRDDDQPGLTFEITIDQKTIQRQCPSWKAAPIRDDDHKQLGTAQLQDCYLMSLIFIKDNDGLKYELTNLEDEIYNHGYVKFGDSYQLTRLHKFRVAGMYQPGDLIDTTSSLASPAILMDINVNGNRKERWVGLEQFFRSSGEPAENGVQLVYRMMKHKLPFKVQLTKVVETKYPGSQKPSFYESKVTIIDKEDGTILQRDVSVNQPLTYKGYTFFQALMDSESRFSGLEVSKDYGKLIIYIGAGVSVLGIIVMFYFMRYV